MANKEKRDWKKSFSAKVLVPILVALITVSGSIFVGVYLSRPKPNPPDPTTASVPTSNGETQITATTKQPSGLGEKVNDAVRLGREAERKANDAKAMAAQAKIVAENIEVPSTTDGYAVYTWDDGSVYAGQWKDGSYDGYGWLLYKDISVYAGEFSNGKAHGYVVFEDKAIQYAGEYDEYRRTGYGVCTFKDSGGTYVGHFSNGVQDGYGVSYDKNGDVKYRGSWKDGKFVKGVQ